MELQFQVNVNNLSQFLQIVSFILNAIFCFLRVTSIILPPPPPPPPPPHPPPPPPYTHTHKIPPIYAKRPIEGQ